MDGCHLYWCECLSAGLWGRIRHVGHAPTSFLLPWSLIATQLSLFLISPPSTHTYLVSFMLSNTPFSPLFCIRKCLISTWTSSMNNPYHPYHLISNRKKQPNLSKRPPPFTPLLFTWQATFFYKFSYFQLISTHFLHLFQLELLQLTNTFTRPFF